MEGAPVVTDLTNGKIIKFIQVNLSLNNIRSFKTLQISKLSKPDSLIIIKTLEICRDTLYQICLSFKFLFHSLVEYR